MLEAYCNRWGQGIGHLEHESMIIWEPHTSSGRRLQNDLCNKWGKDSDLTAIC